MVSTDSCKAMNNVDRLPVEVLEEVFLFYKHDEDIFHPLETLLLV